MFTKPRYNQLSARVKVSEGFGPGIINGVKVAGWLSSVDEDVNNKTDETIVVGASGTKATANFKDGTINMDSKT